MYFSIITAWLFIQAHANNESAPGLRAVAAVLATDTSAIVTLASALLQPCMDRSMTCMRLIIAP